MIKITFRKVRETKAFKPERAARVYFAYFSHQRFHMCSHQCSCYSSSDQNYENVFFKTLQALNTPQPQEQNNTTTTTTTNKTKQKTHLFKKRKKFGPMKVQQGLTREVSFNIAFPLSKGDQLFGSFNLHEL